MRQPKMILYVVGGGAALYFIYRYYYPSSNVGVVGGGGKANQTSSITTLDGGFTSNTIRNGASAYELSLSATADLNPYDVRTALGVSVDGF